MAKHTSSKQAPKPLSKKAIPCNTKGAVSVQKVMKVIHHETGPESGGSFGKFIC